MQQTVLYLATLLFLIVFTLHGRAQAVLTPSEKGYTQSVKGYVTDAASKKPLAGVSILFSPSSATALTDSNGYYQVNGLSVGRYSIEFSSIGYETRVLQDVLISSGKEKELNASLIEKFKSLGAILVSSAKNKTRAINEFATVSARSFTIEETRRYPAAFSDPARMVMNFPGVSAADDGGNSIVVRGNSPAGVLWKLEGIEIPTPNHFSDLGGTGGAVSMLSSNVIGKSDFYTGAFPAEIGNATSAAFDLNFRNGNSNKAEHSVMLGTLGAEVSTEGPLNKEHTSSYLVNYRYSTLALLKHFIELNDANPDYQDLSVKFNWKTAKAGEFSLFGLGGYNEYGRVAKKDSAQWNSDEPNLQYAGHSRLGIIGLTHQIFVQPDAYFKTVLSASYSGQAGGADTLNPVESKYAAIPIGKEAFTNKALRLSSYYNNKLDSRNTIRTGIVAQQWYYDLANHYYDDKKEEWTQILNSDGQTQFYQAFFQWKFRLTSRLSFNSGLHGSYLAFNRKHSIEPRLSASYSVKSQVFSLAAGIHSRPEHISTYMFENKPEQAPSSYSNKELDFTKAAHLVLGYERFFSRMNLKTRIEAYYQHLYKVPVEETTRSGFSTLNMESVYDLENTGRLVSKGTGKNYGVDLSVEKPFSHNYYFMSALSLFRSFYTNYAGREYSTKYDRKYTFNIIGGKEWQHRKDPSRLFGASVKLLSAGGLKNSVIDIPASVLAGREVTAPGEYFTRQAPAYFRLDMSAYIKKDRKRSTHILTLEIQNLTNRANVYRDYFDAGTGAVKTATQVGLLPNLSYKIQF